MCIYIYVCVYVYNNIYICMYVYIHAPCVYVCVCVRGCSTPRKYTTGFCGSPATSRSKLDLAPPQWRCPWSSSTGQVQLGSSRDGDPIVACLFIGSCPSICPKCPKPQVLAINSYMRTCWSCFGDVKETPNRTFIQALWWSSPRLSTCWLEHVTV